MVIEVQQEASGPFQATPFIYPRFLNLIFPEFLGTIIPFHV